MRRLTDYLAVAELYLKNNPLVVSKGVEGTTSSHDRGGTDLVAKSIKREDIKERLLGHWGTCPGINIVYAHCNYLLKNHADLDLFLVVGEYIWLIIDLRSCRVNFFDSSSSAGPGHGAPAVLANLWLEGSLGKFYPDYSHTADGLHNLVKKFGWPGGFPSHTSGEVPGTINEGGELGYALSVSFGAVMDNPNLIVVCLVGDGEAESGPTASAWHGYKYLDPHESGAVLPILHLNRYKIANPTIFGAMDDDELAALFSGYGYQVCIVQDLENIDADMAAAMEWALATIHSIQYAARSDHAIRHPRWPLIILRTPKGWTCPPELPDGKKLEGTWRPHQIPLPKARSDEKQRALLEGWLKSYKVEELIRVKDGSIEVSDEILHLLPEPSRRMG
ncbi:hypothetical protein HDU93_004975, partial [Gonapodya sp. JEL0774]